MSGFIRKLRRSQRSELPGDHELQAQYDEADGQAVEARQTRHHAERTGRAMRVVLEQNHFSEKMALAIDPNSERWRR